MSTDPATADPQPSPGAAHRATAPRGGGVVGFLQTYGIVLALALVCLALTFLILARGIDLSVGSVVALAGVVAASFATTASGSAVAGGPFPVALAFAAGILVGGLAGAVSGVGSRQALPARAMRTTSATACPSRGR